MIPSAGGDQGGGSSGKDDGCCKTILCLIEHVTKSPVLQDRFKAMGFDLESLRRCIETQCQKGKTTVEGRHAETASSEEWRTLTRTPEFGRLISALAASGLAEMKVLEAAKTTPVTRKPKLKASNENMFVMPGELTEKGKKKDKHNL